MSIQLGERVFVILPVTDPAMTLQGQVSVHLFNFAGQQWDHSLGPVLAQVVDPNQLPMQQGPPVIQYEGSLEIQPLRVDPNYHPPFIQGNAYTDNQHIPPNPAPNPEPRPFTRGDRVPALFQMVCMGIILLISCVTLSLNVWISYCGTSVNLQKAGEISLSEVVNACSVLNQDFRRALASSQSCYYCPRTKRNSCHDYCVNSSCGYFCTNPHYDSEDPTTNICTDTCSTSPSTSISSGICRYACDYSTSCDYYCDDPRYYSSPERCSKSCIGSYCGSCDEDLPSYPEPDGSGSGVCTMSCDDFKLLHRAGQVMLGFGISCIVTSAIVILRLGLLFLLRCVLLRGLVVKIAIFVVAGMWIAGSVWVLGC